MITSSPSPTLYSTAHASPSTTFAGRAHYDGAYRPTALQTSSARPRRLHAPPSTNSTPQPTQVGIRQSPSSLQQRIHHREREQGDTNLRRMVDASTQYSPPAQAAAPVTDSEKPISRAASLQLSEARQIQPGVQGNAGTSNSLESHSNAQMSVPEAQTATDGVAATSTKRGTSDLANAKASKPETGPVSKVDIEESPSPKRQRPAAPAVKLMPMQYETCDPRDLVILISSMLMELVRYNDAIPLRDGHLTRFHSRAPPGISVLDYLQRLTTHATLSPPILLSMVYYIDKLCALYPAFTISSLTVHRFLITSATVASKGLSDSFWTNKTYARVGGVSLKELALLELEFLWRVEWRIVPKPEVLVDYYRSLVERNEGYEIDITGKLEEEAEAKGQRDEG
jgi:hypothetical protein